MVVAHFLTQFIRLCQIQDVLGHSAYLLVQLFRLPGSSGTN